MACKEANALDLLAEDHRRIETLLTRLVETRQADAARQLAERICDELAVHLTLEEEIFYPALAALPGPLATAPLLAEHDDLRELIGQLRGASPDSGFYGGIVRTLRRHAGDHIHGAEQPMCGLFARARRSAIDLGAVGLCIAVRRQELLARAEAARRTPAPPRPGRLAVAA